MDRKRELTSVDLAAQEGELSAYEGASVDKVYLYPDDDLLRFRMRHYDHGRIELLVEVGEDKRVNVADPDNVPDAPERPPNFAMMLRNRLRGAELAGVSQFEFDRILELEFERDDGDTTVVAELFGDGNLAVLDGTGEVVDCLETVRLKSRTVAPGTQYEFPSARFNPLTVDETGFEARMRESDADIVRTLATQLNFGGLYGEELCSRAGVDYNVPMEEATDDQIGALYDAVTRLADQLRTGDLDPRVYYEVDDPGGDEAGDGDGDGTGGDEGGSGAADPTEDGRRVDVTPFALEEYADRHGEPFESFNAALDDYFAFAGAEGERAEEGAGGSERPDFESEIQKHEHIIRQQEEAIEDFEAQAQAVRENAEALYADYDLVDEVLSTVQAALDDGHDWAAIEERFEDGAEQGIPAAEAVVGVDGSEGTITVTVDDSEVELVADDGVEKNADRLYQEAKRVEGKKEGAQQAIENTREDLEAVKRRREEWEAADAGAEESGDDDEEIEDVDWLARESIPVRQSEHWFEDFRWFHTSDGFLVIGGRDADDNEALVKKYLDRGDRFFHAQAHGGPATILKATGPSESYDDDIEIPDASKREAAQFAVSYSSVWKDGRYSGDVYEVAPDQVSKTPESGEFLEKGGFAIRGDRTYYEDTEVGVAVGITCEPETRVIGGPPAAIRDRAETYVEVEPGKYAQNDAAMRLYREFKGRFADETFVRKVASADRIQEFLPPGGSRIAEK